MLILIKQTIAASSALLHPWPSRSLIASLGLFQLADSEAILQESPSTPFHDHGMGSLGCGSVLVESADTIELLHCRTEQGRAVGPKSPPVPRPPFPRKPAMLRIDPDRPLADDRRPTAALLLSRRLPLPAI